MRHLTGIVLAIVMTAAMLLAASWGYARLMAQSSRLAAGASLLSDHHALLALGALAGSGLLAGILMAAPRVSPLAAGLPGLLLIGLTGLYLVSVRRADELIPLRSYVFGSGFETMLARGILGAAGLAMIVPLFLPSRWRSRRRDELAGEFGPVMDQDGELAGIGLAGGGGLPVAGVAAGPGAPAAPGAPMVPGAPAPGAPGAPAQPPTVSGAPADTVYEGTVHSGTVHSGTVHHGGGLPQRRRPPGIVY